MSGEKSKFMRSSILAKRWLYFEHQFRLTLLLLLKDSHELGNLINQQPIKRHNNNVFEPLHKKAIIQLGLGKLRFVISLDSQEQYTITIKASRFSFPLLIWKLRISTVP